jgi:hypothetical protein
MHCLICVQLGDVWGTVLQVLWWLLNKARAKEREPADNVANTLLGSTPAAPVQQVVPWSVLT